EDAREAIERLLTDDDLWRRRSAAGLRRVHGEHTYAHRLARIARLAGFDVPAYGDERVAVLLLADGTTAGRALDSLLAQSEPPHEVIAGSASELAGGDGVRHVAQPAGRSRAER